MAVANHSEKFPFEIKLTQTSDNVLSRIGGLGIGTTEAAILEHNGHEIGTINSINNGVETITEFAIPYLHPFVIFHLEFQDGSTGEFTIPTHLIAISFPTENPAEEDNEITGREPALGGNHRIEVP